MLNQLRAHTERAIASAPRVVDAGMPKLDGFGFAGTTGTTFAWNVMPSVRPTAICTHGKRYEWRLQEMLT